MASSKPNYLSKAPVPNNFTLGIRALTYDYLQGEVAEG